MPRPLQTPLPVVDARIIPMSTIEAARIALAEFEYTSDDLDADIDAGAFEWVWDLAARASLNPVSRDGFTQRREIRIYTPCIQQRLNHLKNPKWNVRRFSLAEITQALFPGCNYKWVKSPAVALAFNCSPQHVTDLIRIRALEELAGADPLRPGRNGAATIGWSSIIAFLNTRRI
jgi:hypothetical protein